MVCKDTLRIKHLPKELSDSQKEDFIRHFGAYKVKVITSKAKAKSIVYAKFENEDVAKNVMFRLHQINILNCRLSVEYAEIDILQGQLTTQKVDDSKDGPDKRFFKNFINNINAFNDSVGFYQPPPSHLKYNYPKANRPTINNIAHALATVPRFYTQVLHLMNKMNLPPPFAMPDPPVRTIIGVQPSQHPVAQPAQHPVAQPTQHPVAQASQPSVVAQNSETPSEKRKVQSSSESELESDGESNKNKEIIPQKRTIGQKKTVKRPKLIKPAIVQPTVPSKPVQKAENVFEKVEVQQHKKIELKVSQDSTMSSKIVEEKPLLLEKAAESVPKNVSPPEKKSEPTVAKKATEVLKPLKPAQEKPLQDAHLAVNKSDNVKVKTIDNKIINKPSSVAAELKEKAQLEHTDKPKEPVIVSTDPKEKSSISRTIASHLDASKESENNTTTGGTPRESGDFQEPAEIIKVETISPNEEIEAPPSPEDEFPCISLEELKANQIPDISAMPIFKNYNRGEPTNKLYIKNCAKTVVVQDLEYIYNRYREDSTPDKPSEFNIRLMQEGRMKGQAFVTLDSVEQAEKAVTETNGFILKDKPLVVVFGKAGKKK